MNVYQSVASYFCSPLKRNINIGTLVAKYESVRRIVIVYSPGKEAIQYEGAKDTDWFDQLETNSAFFTFVSHSNEDAYGNVYSKSSVVNLGNSGTGVVNTNASLGDIFTVSLTGDITLANPIGATNGQATTWYLKQDNSGNRAIALGSKFNIPLSATTPLAWSTAGNRMDILAVRYDSAADKFQVISMIPGYA